MLRLRGDPREDGMTVILSPTVTRGNLPRGLDPVQIFRVMDRGREPRRLYMIDPVGAATAGGAFIHTQPRPRRLPGEIRRVGGGWLIVHAGQQIKKALSIGGLDVLRYSGLPFLRGAGTVTCEIWSWSGPGGLFWSRAFYHLGPACSFLNQLFKENAQPCPRFCQGLINCHSDQT